MVSLTRWNRRRAGQQDEETAGRSRSESCRAVGDSDYGCAFRSQSCTGAAGGPGLQVKSPLPGTILSVNVKEGDRVAPRQTLFVLEAMKMENNIDAERGGVVKSIHVQKGATVMEGDLLIVIE